MPFLTYHDHLWKSIWKAEKAIKLSHKLNLCSDEFKKLEESYSILLKKLQEYANVLDGNEGYLHERQRAV